MPLILFAEGLWLHFTLARVVDCLLQGVLAIIIREERYVHRLQSFRHRLCWQVGEGEELIALKVEVQTTALTVAFEVGLGLALNSKVDVLPINNYLVGWPA